ncbi:MAG: glycine--tRNA ligase [Nanoarchaeota archaeon]|nr:glycine--tRNA ligase [Nanoarchaeota archaeon]
MISIEEMATFCKKKGIAFLTSEIYGGFSGFYDFGPMGVELKNNIKAELWKSFVQGRDDVVGMDGATITHPKVWEASGHTASFMDAMVGCDRCREKFRADTLIEDAVQISADGLSVEQLENLIVKHKIHCPKCKGPLSMGQQFNLMFNTQVGPAGAVQAYLRPETAQLIFTAFKNIVDIARVKLPFGIAQAGKAYRNEISPRDFLFRTREFEQFEIEYFTHPKKTECPCFKEVADMKVQILTESKKDLASHTIKDLVENKVFKSKWHAYWVASFYRWFLEHGIKPENLRLREHTKDELAHYAKACFDIEYKFPFGWKEIHGDADRSTFDLDQHMKVSKKDLRLFDEETKEKVVPHVAAEPSQGIERAMLAFLFDAYEDDKERGNIVLKLHPSISPVKVAVFPLVSNKPGLLAMAEEIHRELRKEFNSTYDRSGSIGRRYARQDEIGTPFCITIDFDSLEDKSVTVRHRDSTKQERIKKEDLIGYIKKKL